MDEIRNGISEETGGFEPEEDPEPELTADEILSRELAGEPPFDEDINFDLNK